MKFTKMQGIGNDYVYVNCFKEEVKNPSEVSIFVSDRHFGIGSDGLILIKPSDVADFKMDMYNADGSQAEMCGNGIRCVGKYVYDYGLTDKEDITVETLAGIKKLHFEIEDGKVSLITVDMGEPILEPALVPVDVSVLKPVDKVRDAVIDEPLTVDGKEYNVTCVSMGNPHAIVYVDSTKDLEIEKIGPSFEHHEFFPKRVNTEFIEVINRGEVNMRVWERGAAETWACGTGACASTVAGVLNKVTDNEIILHLLGGDLKVKWDEETKHVFMTGPAKVVFDGEIDI
ncbi:MAG: diaminopimelate epimerase [Lachnospiraceae bacterium]|nr:diaminopimelate epimerase [Lachnospiraceae bacterium]